MSLEEMAAMADYNRERFSEYCTRHAIHYTGDCHLCEREWADHEEARSYMADMLDAQEGF